MPADDSRQQQASSACQAANRTLRLIYLRAVQFALLRTRRQSGGGMGSSCGVRKFSCLAIFLLSAFSGWGANGPTITLSVDASEAPRKIIHAQLRVPAKPGTLTLYYPKWIPGEHGPTGPITDLTGLKFTASGKTLPWRRDLQEGFEFHVEVPAGENEVIANLDYASPASFEPGYSSGLSATEKLYIVNWNTLLLYPAGYGSDQLTYSASLRLPAGWNSVWCAALHRLPLPAHPERSRRAFWIGASRIE